jgi:selenocysteine lyase/cysteine desulfurase
LGEDGIQSVPERARVYLNNAATSFPKPPGMAEEVAAEKGLVLTTALEHNSVLRPLDRIAGNGVQLEIVPCDVEGRAREDLWREAVEKRTSRVAVLNHASNAAGAVNDASALSGFARDRGCRIVLDASRTIGLEDMEVSELKVDIVISTGYKNLLGPAGTRP